jgi:hypothetical protein
MVSNGDCPALLFNIPSARRARGVVYPKTDTGGETGRKEEGTSRSKQNQFDRKGETGVNRDRRFIIRHQDESRNCFRRYDEFAEEVGQMGYKQAA